MIVRFHTRWFENIAGCPDGVRLAIYEAVLSYAMTGYVPHLEPTTETIFRFILEDIRRDEELKSKRADAGRSKRKQTEANTKQNEANGKQNEANTKQTEANGKQSEANGKQTQANASKEEEETKEEEIFPLDNLPSIEEENKEKEERKKPAKKAFAEDVHLLQDEYDKLISLYGEQATSWMIDKLNNYKLSKGARYKSDYRAILSWVVKEWEYGKTKQTDRPSKAERDADFAQWAAEKLAGTGDC